MDGSCFLSYSPLFTFTQVSLVADTLSTAPESMPRTRTATPGMGSAVTLRGRTGPPIDPDVFSPEKPRVLFSTWWVFQADTGGDCVASLWLSA